MLPPVLERQLVHPFSYWRNGLCQGMRYGSDLYDHVRTYALSDRLHAYGLACDMADQGQKTCITRAADRYDVWVDMRSLYPPTPEDREPSHPVRQLVGQSVS